MTTLDLRSLPDPARLDKINEAVAVHCDGWTRDTHAVNGKPTLTCDEEWFYAEDAPAYSTSYDAVLPLLEKAGFFPIIMRPWKSGTASLERVWEVSFHEQTGRSYAWTLAEALCLALLRANGVEVLT